MFGHVTVDVGWGKKEKEKTTLPLVLSYTDSHTAALEQSRHLPWVPMRSKHYPSPPFVDMPQSRKGCPYPGHPYSNI
jgi:hypothetical protein